MKRADLRTNLLMKEVSEHMTLRELRERIESTAGIPIPTRKALLEVAEPFDVYVSSIIPDYMISVFPNGFAVAESRRRYTVVRADQCLSYTYDYSDHTATGYEYEKPVVIDESVFLDQPWPVRIMLTVDDQLWANEENREGRWLSEHPEIPDDKEWMLGNYVSFEDRVIARMEWEEALSNLTEMQRVMFRLYKEEGYTQDEIAQILGIGRTTVKKHLEFALRRLRRYYCQSI